MILATIIRKITEWQRYRRNLRELSRLDDRELADIGISRADLDTIARSASRA